MSSGRFRSIFAAAFSVVLFSSAFGQTPSAQPPPSPGAGVTLDGHTLFTVRTSLGPFSAEVRAAATEQRLLGVAEDLTIPVGAVNTLVADTSTDIVAGDRVLLTITDEDAKAAQKPRAEIASSYVATIRSAIAARRAEYSLRSLIAGALYTGISTLALLSLLWGLRRLFPLLYSRLNSNRGDLVRSIRIQQVEIVSADRLKSLLVRFFKIVRALIVLTILYIYIPLVLSFFPWTRLYAPTLVGYVINPLRDAGVAFLSYIPSLIVVVIVIAVAWACTRVSAFLFDQIEKGGITWSGFYPEWAAPTHQIVRFLILAFSAVIIFPYLPGARSPAFQGISIFLGVLFSLGSTSAVANIVAGAILTYTRAFQVGDRVKIAETVGDVLDRTLLATRVQTIKNEVVTVPNSLVLGSHITNFSLHSSIERPLILHTTVTIGYDAPWRMVHDLLISAALGTGGILNEPRPFVLQTALDDFYVHYQINGYTPEPARMAAIYAELHQNIQDRFNEAGVEIMSAHYSSLRDGNRKTIPDEYLAETYTAPAFRVDSDRPRTRSQKAAAAGGEAD